MKECVGAEGWLTAAWEALAEGARLACKTYNSGNEMNPDDWNPMFVMFNSLLVKTKEVFKGNKVLNNIKFSTTSPNVEKNEVDYNGFSLYGVANTVAAICAKSK